MKKIKTIIWLLFLVNFSNLFGQDSKCEELKMKIDQLYDFGDIASAIELAENSIETCFREYGEADTGYVSLKTTLAYMNFRQKQYRKSINLYLDILQIFKKDLGEYHININDNLRILGQAYQNIGKKDSAFYFLNKALNVTTKNHDPKRCDILSDLAIAYNEAGDFSTALDLMNESLQTSKRDYGDSSKMYLSKIHNLGCLHKVQNNFEKAIELFKQSENLNRKHLGIHHHNYKSSLISLSGIYFTIGDYQNALKDANKGVNLLESEGSLDSVSLCNFFSLKARILNKIGRSQEALSYIQISINYLKKNVEKTNPVLNYDYKILGEIYSNLGLYKEGCKVLIEAMNNFQELFKTKRNPLFLVTFDSYVDILHKQNKSHKSLPLYEEIVYLAKETYGEKSIQLSNHINDLALVYKDLGLHRKALKYLIESNEIEKNVYKNPKEHSGYISSCFSIGQLYNSIGESEKGLVYFQNAFEFQNALNNKGYHRLARYTHGISQAYLKLKEYDLALLYARKALGNCKKLSYHPHFQFAVTYNVLGNIFYNQRIIDSALFYHSLSHLELIQVSRGNYDLDLAVSYYKLAESYEANDSIQQCGKFLEKLLGICIYHYQLNFLNLSTNDKEKFIKLYIKPQNFFPSFAYRHQNQMDFPTILAFNSSLFWKNLLLDSSKKLSFFALEIQDSTEKNTFNKLLNLNSEYANLQVNTLSKDNKIKSKEISLKIEELEKKLAKSTNKILADSKPISFENIVKTLESNSAIVDFIHFNYFNHLETDSILYCALVLQQDFSSPKLIPLFEEKKLLQLIKTPIRNYTDPIDKLYDLYRGGTSRKITYDSLQLYKLIWQPLDSLLQDVKKIYYSPSGLLHRISFPAIASDTNRLISDDYELIYLPSTRELAFEEEPPKPIETAMVFGGINYDADSTALVNGNALAMKAMQNWTKTIVPEKVTYLDTLDYEKDLTFTDFNQEIIRDTILEKRRNAIKRSTNAKKMYPLPKSRVELDTISKVFHNKGLRTVALSDNLATEDAFKKLGTKDLPSPDIIHISTHGFFFSDPNKARDEKTAGFKYAENPLFRSGLVLAGGNHLWTGNMPYQNLDDGILTAYEIANIDLSTTELVVLTACETALGDIRGSEGVYGLQRAFKLAGVDHLLMTLWKIPDSDAVIQFMNKFYQKLFSGMSVRDAFYETQREAKDDPDIGMDVWGAFVLI